MLSLILYGRNDSHGYNLHKRAAISLNAIAEVVSHVEDEIIFVDYNTPDELPTFLETIADTLTERAKRFIRIIRVRPEFHKRYASQTNLVALESQSRNIAIRRANPANRWILSTNTDMIFVPANRDETLSDICAGTLDGFYHLPRFELPEGFWERADRLNPIGMIEQVRSFGTRYHLNEVVYGGFDNVYEAPGDFQLFLREDLHRIGGFDETMIKGWHVDTNTARRMKLLRGKVDTLFPKIYGYHCGHTRQATSLHGARRTENSLDTYVRNLTSPLWTTDDDWGAPDEVFEEVRLGESRTTLFLAAMNLAISTEGPDYTEATYNETTYCQEGFDAAHILPYVGDVLFNLKAGQTVFMVGSDPELISGLSKFITSPPMEASFFVCADEKSPGSGFPAPSLSLAQGLDRADILVLQYPNHRTVPVDERADLEWFAQKALEQIIDVERNRDRADRRRVIVINGMHSLLQELLGDALDAAAMPFSARLRQGRVFDPHWPTHPPVDSVAADQPAYARLGRIRSFSTAELELLAKVFAAGQNDPAVDGWERLAPEIAGLARQRDFLKSRLGADPDAVTGVEQRARESITQAEARVAGPLVAVPPRPDTANRICSSSDWESPDWAALAIRYFGERAYSQTTRSRWLWERISLIHELRRRIPAVERPWVLVVSEGPDPIAAMAAHQGFRVAYVNTDALLTGAPTQSWSDAFRMFNIVLPGSILPLDKVPPGVRFAAMLAPGSTLFWRERERAHNVVAKAAALMMSKAHLGVSSLVHINSSRNGGSLSLDEFEQAFTPTGVMSQLGVSGDAPVDARIPLDTAVRFAMNDRETESAPGLSFGFSPHSNISLAMMWGRFPETAGQVAPTQIRTPEPVRTGLQPEPVKAAPASPQRLVTAAAARDESDLASARAFAATMLGRVIAFPAVFTSLRRNLLPSVVSARIRERSVIRLLMGAEADELVRFGVPIADVGPGVVSLHIAVAGVSGPEAVSVVFLGENGHAEGVVTGSRGILMVRFETAERLGNGLAVFEVGAQALEVSVLSAARDSAAMSVA